MSANFRQEMFADVIAFLDEFARYESVESEADSGGKSLTTSYLEIAEAALEVGQWSEAVTAAERAMARVNTRIRNQQPVSGNALLDQSHSARVLSDALRQQTSADNLAETRVVQLANLAVSSAGQAVTLLPNDPDAKLEWLQARAVAIRSGVESAKSSPNRAQLIKTLYQDFPETKIVDSAVNRLLRSPQGPALLKLKIEIGGLMVSETASEEVPALFQAIEIDIKRLREALRLRRSSLLESDFLLGQFLVQKATWHWNRQERDDASKVIANAISSLRELVDRNPQNRIGQRELADTFSVAAGWLSDQGKYKEAREHSNQAIVHFVNLIETDAADLACRLAVVDELNHYGELSVLLNEPAQAFRGFFTAAQDCRLLMGRTEPYKEWAFQTRLWALSKAKPFVKFSENPKFASSEPNKFMEREVEAGRVNNPDLDHEWALRVVIDNHPIERPSPIPRKKP